MEEEIWKPISDYEGLYEVSNLGRVKSLNYRHTGKEKILSPVKGVSGYLRVNLYKGGKCKEYYIHRLVLMTFNPVVDMDRLEINHLDEDKTSNVLENLEWCDRSYNINYGTHNARVAEKQYIPVVQLSIEGRYIRSWKGTNDAEREEGFNHGNINSCCRGRLKTHGGYKWQYLHDYISQIDPRIKKVILFDKEYEF